jgi:hypothetical protein
LTLTRHRRSQTAVNGKFAIASCTAGWLRRLVRLATRNWAGAGAFSARNQGGLLVATASGVITVAQESRFQLALDQGGTRLFMLAHDAAIEPGQLLELQRAQTHVAVTFRPAAGLIAGAARAVTETSETSF